MNTICRLTYWLLIHLFIYTWIYFDVYIGNLYIVRERLLVEVGHLQTLSMNMTQGHLDNLLPLLEQNAPWKEN